jgi:hypothetical protein
LGIASAPSCLLLIRRSLSEETRASAAPVLNEPLDERFMVWWQIRSMASSSTRAASLSAAVRRS